MQEKEKRVYSMKGISSKLKKQREENRIFVEDIDINYLKTMAVIFFKKTISEIDGPARDWDVKVVRHILLYIAYYNTYIPLKEIGVYFGNRDHTTVLNARNANQDRLDTEPDVKKQYNEFIDFLGLEKIKQEELA